MALAKYKGFVAGDKLPAENVNSIDPDSLESPIVNEAFRIVRLTIAGLLPSGILTGVDGSGLINILNFTNYVVVSASNNLKYSSDTERQNTTYDNQYHKQKEFKVYKNGTYRVKFDAKSSSNYTGTFVRIYKNGVAFGTERDLSSVQAYQTYSEDLVFSPLDTIELWSKSSSAGSVSAYVKNFRLYFDRTEVLDGVNTLD